MRWLRRKAKGDTPSEYYWNRPCLFCDHPAGYHRWVEPAQGERMVHSKYKTNCHRCLCPYYRDGNL